MHGSETSTLWKKYISKNTTLEMKCSSWELWRAVAWGSNSEMMMSVMNLIYFHFYTITYTKMKKNFEAACGSDGRHIYGHKCVLNYKSTKKGTVVDSCSRNGLEPQTMEWRRQ